MISQHVNVANRYSWFQVLRHVRLAHVDSRFLRLRLDTVGALRDCELYMNAVNDPEQLEALDWANKLRPSWPFQVGQSPSPREPHRERGVNCYVTLASNQSALLVSCIPRISAYRGNNLSSPRGSVI